MLILQKHNGNPAASSLLFFYSSHCIFYLQYKTVNFSDSKKMLILQ